MLYEKLDYVLAIAEEQNLTRAAKKLYISQPTLTMYLNRLEENLGVKLFDRRKTPITITPAGRRYIEKMTEISEEEQILRMANGIHPEFRRHISELKCAVRFFQSDGDYYVYFETGFEEVLATVNPDGWCQIRCLE